MGINGKIGSEYNVPAGKQFIAYQWTYTAISATAAFPRHRVELGRTVDSAFTDWAAINPDAVIGVRGYEGGVDVYNFNEVNSIAVLFDELETPQARIVPLASTANGIVGPSLEVYGIESDKGAR